MACVISDQTLRMKIDGNWKTCDFEGQLIKLRGRNSDHVICPNPSRTCPSFYCPRNCLEFAGGVCSYATGQCVCPLGSEDCNTPLLYENSVDGENITSMALYFTDATVLSNDHKSFFEKTQMAFEKMTTKRILYMLLLIIGCLLFTTISVYSVVRILEKKNKTRQLDKDKMIATMLVDLRVRNNDTRRTEIKERRRLERIRQFSRRHGRKSAIEKLTRRTRRFKSQHLKANEVKAIDIFDTYSTESTATSRQSGTENSMSLEGESAFGSSVEADGEHSLGCDIINESKTIDLARTAELDGNIYTNDENERQNFESNLSLDKDELRHRTAATVFRHHL